MTRQAYMRAAGLGLILLLLVAVPAFAQAGQYSESVYKNLEFRHIGPAIMGGRIDDFAVVEGDTSIIYVATASGGVWKTTNGGVTWTPIFDDHPVSSIGDVTLAPSDPNIVWVGTGEANNRQSSSWGNGVYKSLDGGRTWTLMGLAETHHIGRIAIDPRDPNIVYVAAAGRLWGPSRERGVFKTTDGGKTWNHALFINEDTGVIDIALDPQSSLTLYAAAYQRRRTPSGFNGGGPHSSLYKTIDGGATWRKLTNGLPAGDTGRIGIDIYRKSPNVVYAMIENKDGGTFRSDDRGETWRKMSSTNPRPMYYSQVRIDPSNDQRIWVLGAQMYVSEDGGRTFQTNVVTRIHGDYHAMWINPADSDHMLAGSDGGIHISYDRGRTWNYLNTLPLGQFYEISVDSRKPYYIYGGLQDNGAWAGPSATLYTAGITNEDWIRVGGGDGFYTVPDTTDHNIIYVESQNGNLSRLDLRTGERRTIRPEAKPGEPAYRFDWNSPLIISPHNNRTLYFGGNRLFKSTDRGDSWTASADLTTQPDRDKMPIMGALPGRDMLSRHDGQSTYGQIVALTESPIKEGLVYVGTDDGNLQVSRDGGKTFKNVIDRVPGVPKNTYVSRVIASRFAEGRAYVTFDGHRNNDFKPYVFTTNDYGDTWRSISSDIPAGLAVNVIHEHPKNENLLFIGTEFGAFVSFNRGGQWLPLKNNMPTVPVDDIAIHPRDNDLIFGTHGRSISVLDDITPLEQLTETVLASELTLFDMRPATSYRRYNHKGNTGHEFFIGANPDYGALVNYYLKSKAAGDVKITITDSAGKVVRELAGPGGAGINRIAWDLRWTPPVEQQAGAGGGGFFGPPRGPLALPAVYTVKVSAGNLQASKTVRVDEDSRIQISEADRRAHFDTLMTLNRLLKSADEARRAIESVNGPVNQLVQSLKQNPRTPAALSSAADNLSKQISTLRARIVAQPPGNESAGPDLPGTVRPLQPRIGQLLGAIDGYTAAPTPAQREQVQALSTELRTLLGEINKLSEQDIPNLNRQMADNNVPFLRPPNRLEPPE